MARFAARACAWAALALIAPAAARAQVTPGAQAPPGAGVLAVVVRDASGAGVAGAGVSASGAVAVRGITDQNGEVRFTSLSAGRYQVRVRLIGYAPAAEVVTLTGEAPETRLELTLTPVPVSLDALVVTAARREQLLKDAVVETQLVTREDIARTAAPDLSAVLTQRAGVELDGGVPAGDGVLLQGMGSQRVLILLDGQPLVGRVNGNFDISRLPLSMIQRVEVVRGPQSTLYGSDALGGVINVITRPPADAFGATASAIGGSQGRREVSLGARGSAGALGYVLDGGFRTVDLAPGITGDAGTLARRWSAAPRLVWRPDSQLTVDASGLVVGERQRYRVGQLFQFADNTQWSGSLAAAWRDGSHRIEPVLHFTEFRHLSRASTGPQPATDSGATDVQQLLQGELQYTGPLPAGGVLDAGVEARREGIRADRVQGGARTLHAVEPYAQATFQAGPVSIVPGARYTWNERWGSFVAPRLALMVRPSGPLALRASVGRGFRAPDFKELYLNFVNAAVGYAVVGNPSLRPETSTSASLGAEWAGSRVYARASVFAARFRDFIETGSADATGTYTYENVATGSTGGVDVEGALAAGRWRFDAGYSYLRTRDGETGGPLLGRPPHAARASADMALGSRLHLSLGGQYTARTPDQRDSLGVVTGWRPDYLRFDLHTSVVLPGDFEITGGLDNVFNRRVGTAWPGYTGRQAFVGLTWRVGRS